MTVDPNIEAGAAELRQAVAGRTWFHTIDLGNGVRTPGHKDTAAEWEHLHLPDLAGRSVLDVGAYDGFFSFEAERRGAARVVASDHWVWNWPGSDARGNFELAWRTLGSRVQMRDIPVEEISPDTLGATFDVVLFLGVLYHLRHPFLALEHVASVTREYLIVETVVDLVGLARPAMAFYPGRELNNDPTNWWGPNIPAVVGMLNTLGFMHVRVATPLPGAVYRGARALYHRIRGKNTMAQAFRQDRAVFHAKR